MRKLFLLPLLFTTLLSTTLLSADLANELIEMARESQDCRMELLQIEWKDQSPNEKLRTEIVECDRRTTERLKEIVAEHGWPRKSIVGASAAKAAWLVAQHSKHDPEFMEQILRRITPLMAQGEVDPEQFALIADHISVLHGEPQLYGTQYTCEWIGGGLQLTPSSPVFEPHLLEYRREGLGLIPHTEYLQKLAAILVKNPDDS